MADYSEQIQRIKLKLRAAKRKDRAFNVFGSKSHKYRLSKPASRKTIERIENTYRISLPDCYKTFVSQIGNGGRPSFNAGAGPYYGIFPLGEEIDFIVSDPENHLSKPCILSPDLSDEYWDDLTRSVLNFDDMSDEEYDLAAGNIYAGILPIVSQGCTYLNGLVVTGPYKGRVVNLDFEFGKPSFAFEENFLDWYERWLDEVILGALDKSPSWFGFQKRTCDHIPIDSPLLQH